jgi:outer membrane receptor for ferrienterochelin and colicins
MFILPRAALLVGALLILPTSGGAQTPIAEVEEPEEIVVQATRTGRRIQDEPVRVEVIDREEIEEKILMRPGNVAIILSETGGLRVQVTSPALGAANIRVQGLDGRFTQLLADGLPLYGGQASSLGLLQIPPTDLGQVEVIKGAASALYGPSALGGVINLVSRRPKRFTEAETLLNLTSRGGRDATAYVATPLAGDWSASLTGGHHRQRRRDLDGDDWSDIPGYRRSTVRPRLFWSGDDGSSLFVTVGGMTERRRGGTREDGRVPDGQPFPQNQDTDRFDSGLVAQTSVDGIGKIQFRASGMTQKHRHRFGSAIERDRHGTAFAEVSISDRAGGTSWLGGIAYQVDGFRSNAFPAFDYTYRAPAIFGQVEQDLLGDLTLAASGRADFHDEYGTRLSPRASLLYRPGYWTVRLSAARGFYAPTPFVEEIEDAGLSRLDPLTDLRAETVTSGSLDVGYQRGAIEVNATLFASDLRNSTDLAPVIGRTDRVALVNLPGTAHIRGGELLVRHRWDDFSLTGSYVHMHADEVDIVGKRRTKPLTPRHSAGIVGMWEKEDVGRVGVEFYYTGRQELDDDPYRTRSRPYVEIGFLGEIVVGPARLFLNAENILGVRQTRYAPLVRPTRAPDGRWTVDVWGPTDGFVLNGGVRLRFGSEGR